jgi:hypothetical protein
MQFVEKAWPRQECGWQVDAAEGPLSASSLMMESLMAEFPGQLTSKLDERDGVDGARTGISLNGRAVLRRLSLSNPLKERRPWESLSPICFCHDCWPRSGQALVLCAPDTPGREGSDESARASAAARGTKQRYQVTNDPFERLLVEHRLEGRRGEKGPAKLSTG